MQFIKRAGHALPLSHPLELAALVAAWLDAREPASSATRVFAGVA